MLTLWALARALSALRWSHRAFLACLSMPAGERARVLGAGGWTCSPELPCDCLAILAACSQSALLQAQAVNSNGTRPLADAYLHADCLAC